MERQEFEKWQEFERRVRSIATYLWDCQTESDTINGVRIDCICKIKPDYWMLVEITREKTLQKLRTDLAKFAAVRPYLFSKNTYAECYFVCESKPPQSLIQTGEGQNVIVMSLDSFQNKFFDYSRYTYLRLSKPFGSAVNPNAGTKDDIKYVPVEYIDTKRNKNYRVGDIIGLLVKGNRIILLGNYGTGKSRCLQELFEHFSSFQAQALHYPLSIDLRDHWGTRRGTEIIRRHFDNLGLSRQADNIVKVIPKGGIILLLDGFDEIGSQTWSDDPTKLKDIRAKSLMGVNDLIKQSPGGVKNREH